MNKRIEKNTRNSEYSSENQTKVLTQVTFYKPNPGKLGNALIAKLNVKS